MGDLSSGARPSVDLTEPREPQASLGELFGRLSELTSRLVRDEVQLAKAELQEDIKRYGKAGGMLGAAGYLGHITMVALVMMLGFGLGQALDHQYWLGFLITLVIFGAVAAVLAMNGRKRIQEATPPVEMTRETVQETAQYLKEHV